nr:lipase family protein [Alicyclobacillus sp. SO9]
MSKPSFSAPANNLQEALLMAGFSYQGYHFMIGPDMNLPSESRHLYTFYTPNHEYFASIIETNDVGAEKAYILLFRGTETSILHPVDTVEDIHVDLNLVQVPFDSGDSNAKVHRGYKELYQSLFTSHWLQTDKSIIEVMNTLDSHSPLYITGHSLGGALATLAAVDIVRNTQFQNIKVYTFASPRVGNAAFVSDYNQLVPDTVRVVNANDYVPLEPQVQVPFEEPLYYYHVQGKLSIDFNTQSIIHNHSITHYFRKLAEQEPAFYRELYDACPEFCPPDNPSHSEESRTAIHPAFESQPRAQAPVTPTTVTPTPVTPTTVTPTPVTPTPVTSTPVTPTPVTSTPVTPTPVTPTPVTPTPVTPAPVTSTPVTPTPVTPTPVTPTPVTPTPVTPTPVTPTPVTPTPVTPTPVTPTTVTPTTVTPTPVTPTPVTPTPVTPTPVTPTPVTPTPVAPAGQISVRRTLSKKRERTALPANNLGSTAAPLQRTGVSTKYPTIFIKKLRVPHPSSKARRR